MFPMLLLPSVREVLIKTPSPTQASHTTAVKKASTKVVDKLEVKRKLETAHKRLKDRNSSLKRTTTNLLAVPIFKIINKLHTHLKVVCPDITLKLNQDKRIPSSLTN